MAFNINTFLIFITILSISFVQQEPAPYEYLFLIIFLYFLINGKNKLSSLNKLLQPVLLLGFFLLINILSIFNAENLKHAVYYFIITAYLIVTYFFFKIVSKDKEIISFIVYGYMVSSILAVLLGIAGWFFPQSIFKSFLYYEVRMQGPFADPNVFGAFLVFSTIYYLHKIMSFTKINRLLLINIIITSLLLTGITLSFSRGAWINLFVAILIFIVMSFKKFSLKICLNYALLAIFFLILTSGLLTYGEKWNYMFSRFGFQKYDEERFETQRKGLQVSLGKDLGEEKGVLDIPQHDKERFEAQRKGLQAGMGKDLGEEKGILDIPLWWKFFGMGPGQFEVKFDYAAHSLYFRILGENGWPGLIFFLGFLTYLLSCLYRFTRYGKEVAGLSPEVLVPTTVGLLLNSFVIDTLHWRHLWLIFALISITECYSRNGNDLNQAETK